MRQQINKINLFLLVAVTAFLFSCTDDKDYYDPERQNENKLGVTAPSGFGWETTRSTSVKVEVNDEFSGAYKYGIKIFDQNPITEKESAIVLASGVAKQGQAFTTQIALPVNVESVFIQQTAPDGLVSVRYANITNGSINSNFGATSSNRSRSIRITAARRAGDDEIDFTVPDPNDKTIFPTEAPEGAIPITATTSFSKDKDYIINSNTPTNFSLGSYSNVGLYVTEDATINSISNLAGRKICLLPNTKLTITEGLGASTANWIVSVGEGSTLTISGSAGIKADHNTQIYNLGTINAVSYHGLKTSILYNAGQLNFSGTTTTTVQVGSKDSSPLLYNVGTINVAGGTSSTNGSIIYNGGSASLTVGGTLTQNSSGNKFINDGDATCGAYTSTGSATTTNNGTIKVNGLTTFNSPDTWTNNGLWETQNMNTIAYKAGYFNNCKLIVHEKLSLEQARFYNNAGAYVYATEMYMKNTRVEQGTGAFFHVDGVASLLENRVTDDKGEGFYGVGEGIALLKMETVVRGNTSPNMVYYAGNLGIICDNHPEKVSGSDKVWAMDENVIWSSSSNNSISIPENGECNPGFNTDPKEPEDPDPDPDPDPYPYTYLFEDLWPFYGDYDMNDAVIQVTKITKTKNDANLVTALSFDYSLKAVGAGSGIGAALMLDAIAASSVSNVTYSSNTPNVFETTSTGLESGQNRAVIPLFSDGAALLGRSIGEFVNTVKGSSSNVSSVPTITVRIDFTSPISDNFDATTFNMFIISYPNEQAVTSAIRSTNRKEVHMLGYSPSNRANTALFGNNDDRSTSNRYYVSRDNLTWAIVIPYDFRWPVEWKEINKAYTGFNGWVTSEGTQNTDWWLTPSNLDFVY